MRLVTVAHGTRTPAGNDVAREITELAAERLGLESVCSFVELSSPLFADVVAGSSEPTVGAAPGQPVVMVAAGSRDPFATRDLTTAVALLAAAWGGAVRLATLSGRGQRPAAVVRRYEAVSPYLLAAGNFADRCRAEVPTGAVVADVIGAHPLLVELVTQRARSLVAGRLSA